ncbi:MAG: hypothetical protein FJ100_03655 [Deltaproteobacteria bacterium]|nr:hypothetical protein [Deltaproteobacteria bacterium]
MWVALLHDAVRAAFPSTARVPGLDRLDSRPFLRQLLRQAPWTLWFGAVGSAIAWQVTPVLTIGWPVPAAMLPAAARDRHANAMSGHGLYLVRMAMVMIKTVGGLYWGAAPEVRTALGLPLYGTDPATVRDEELAGRAIWPQSQGTP